MFCPKCGAQLPDGAKFCGKCGARITPAEPVPDANSVTPTTVPVPDTTPAPGMTVPLPVSVASGPTIHAKPRPRAKSSGHASAGGISVPRLIVAAVTAVALVLSFFTPAFKTDADVVSYSSFASDAGGFLESLSGESLGASSLQFKDSYSWAALGDFDNTYEQYAEMAAEASRLAASMSGSLSLDTSGRTVGPGTILVPVMWVVLLVATVGILLYLLRGKKGLLVAGMILLVLADAVGLAIGGISDGVLTGSAYLVFGLILAIGAAAGGVMVRE